jgi:hypothetical protein
VIARDAVAVCESEQAEANNVSKAIHNMREVHIRLGVNWVRNIPPKWSIYVGKRYGTNRAGVLVQRKFAPGDLWTRHDPDLIRRKAILILRNKLNKFWVNVKSLPAYP